MTEDSFPQSKGRSQHMHQLHHDAGKPSRIYRILHIWFELKISRGGAVLEVCG